MHLPNRQLNSQHRVELSKTFIYRENLLDWGMAKLQFYPLNISYKSGENDAIYLYGRAADGSMVCVVDESFEPYFYASSKEAEKLAEDISKMRFEHRGREFSLARAETERKKLFGKEQSFVKVFTKNHSDFPAVVKQVSGAVFEADISPVRKYLLDKDVKPLTLCEAEGDYVNLKSKVSVFKASSVTSFSDEIIKDLKILAFDIETHSSLGKISVPDNNPIIMVAFYANGFEKVITWKRFETDLSCIEFVENEKELIRRFSEVIESYRPDMLVGYYSDGFDLPYIQARAERNNMNLRLGLDYSELNIDKRRESASIAGIIHIDIYKFIRRVAGGALETSFYDLNSVALEILGEEKLDVDMDELADVWSNRPQDLEQYCRYNLQDAKLTYNICTELMPGMVELVKLVGVPIYEISRMGFSQMVEGYLMKQAKYLNEVIPRKPDYEEVRERRIRTYKGAFVYKPEPGLYKEIAVFDFRSLYPSIISSHNISCETLNCDCCRLEAELTPETKTWFCKKKRGFISEVIDDLITRRMRIKELMKVAEKKKLLDARQNALKTIANAMYGYFGFFGARWYSIECANSITAYGRYYITKVIDRAKQQGFNVIYSDTDSVFLTLGSKARKDVTGFVDKINFELTGLMELNLEAFYPAGLFVSAKETGFGAKKKYALLSEDGAIKIRGFETVRRNISFIAKQVQENVLRMILKEENPEKAFDYVRQIVNKLRKKEIPLEHVIIHTQLKKDISEYDSIGPHVAVAKRIIQQGTSVEPGSVIRYIIVQGKDRIRDRARLPEEVANDEYDAEYYINNQVIPAVEGIFKVLNFNTEELKEDREQEKLGKFIGSGKS